jgi:hypothetical protein
LIILYSGRTFWVGLIFLWHNSSEPVFGGRIGGRGVLIFPEIIFAELMWVAYVAEFWSQLNGHQMFNSRDPKFGLGGEEYF